MIVNIRVDILGPINLGKLSINRIMHLFLANLLVTDL